MVFLSYQGEGEVSIPMDPLGLRNIKFPEIFIEMTKNSFVQFLVFAWWNLFGTQLLETDEKSFLLYFIQI